MSAFPILSRFQQDAHIKTVEIEPGQTMDEVAATCAFHSIGLHVADKPGRTLRVRPTTEDDSAPPWPRDLTVEKAGIRFYDCIDIYFEEPLARAHRGWSDRRMAFKKACTLDDIWEGDMETFDVDGTEVLLVHVEGEGIHALQAQCPHQEVDLVDGDLDGRVLTCMMHLWEFDVVAGKGVNPDHAEIAQYPVKIEGEDVLVDVEGIEPKHAKP